MTIPKPLIVHIDLHGPFDINLPNIEQRHYGSWATRFARHIIGSTDAFNIEIWKLYNPKDYGFHGITERNKDGLKFRLFPSRKIFGFYFSLSLLLALVKNIKNKTSVLFHLQTVDGVMEYLIAILCHKSPLVAQQRGPNSPPLWRYKFTGRKSYLLVNFLRKISLKNFDFIFCSSLGSLLEFSKKVGVEKVVHSKGGGFDFDKFPPLKKEKLREDLGLSPDKKLLLHIGRFKKLKGLDTILEFYKEYKDVLNIDLVIIGGSKNDILYKEVIKSGAIVKEYISKNKVVDYMRATDIHLLPTKDRQWIPFGDIPTALIESLALNQPVVSPMLIHFAGTKVERQKLGHLSNSKKDLFDSISLIIDNYHYFSKTRDIVKKYYSWDIIINRNTKVYKRLFNVYYKLDIS